MSDIHDLETALRLTEAMLEAARGQDWDRLVELEAVRRGHIATAFKGSVSGDDAPVFAEIAQQILSLDRELVRLGEEGRLSLAEALSRIQAGTRARKAYALGSG
jgi:hypothetical protein